MNYMQTDGNPRWQIIVKDDANNTAGWISRDNRTKRLMFDEMGAAPDGGYIKPVLYAGNLREMKRKIEARYAAS